MLFGVAPNCVIVLLLMWTHCEPAWSVCVSVCVCGKQKRLIVHASVQVCTVCVTVSSACLHVCVRCVCFCVYASTYTQKCDWAVYCVDVLVCQSHR